MQNSGRKACCSPGGWSKPGHDSSPCSVDGQWDSHKDNFTAHRALIPPWDQAIATLIEDLDSRGLLDTTLLVIGGEFGRTPKINKDAGRDHWPMVYTTVLAGGGLKGGAILGESDALGEAPEDTTDQRARRVGHGLSPTGHQHA